VGSTTSLYIIITRNNVPYVLGNFEGDINFAKLDLLHSRQLTVPQKQWWQEIN